MLRHTPASMSINRLYPVTCEHHLEGLGPSPKNLESSVSAQMAMISMLCPLGRWTRTDRGIPAFSLYA